MDPGSTNHASEVLKYLLLLNGYLIGRGLRQVSVGRCSRSLCGCREFFARYGRRVVDARERMLSRHNPPAPKLCDDAKEVLT